MAAGGGRSKRGVKWRETETLDLLAIWGDDKVQEALGRSHQHLDIFQRIAKEMAARGHRRTAVECRTKTKSLRIEYGRASARSNRSGGGPAASCPFYPQLHRILRRGVARSETPQFTVEDPAPSQDCAPGSEQTSSHEQVTLKPEARGTSAPTVAGEVASPEGYSNGPSNPSSDPAGTVTDPNSQQHTAGVRSSTEGGNVGDTEAPTRSVGEDDRAGPRDGRGVECRSATPYNRRKNLSVLSNVGREMLQHSVQEAEAARRRHAELLQEDRRHEEVFKHRYRILLEETRLERKFFQNAVERNMAMMESAVNAFKYMGEIFMRGGAS